MLDSNSLASLAKIIIEISRQSGSIILQHYKQDDLKVIKKQDQSPVTIADHVAHKFIDSQLSSEKVKAIIDCPIISEEGKIKNFPLDYKDYYWCVDPLDGTKEFIAQNGEFTVNIALIYQHQPILGVIYAPVLDKLYYAVKNQGAYLISKQQTTTLKTKKLTWTKSTLNILTSRSHRSNKLETFLARFHEPNHLQCGSSLKYGLIAEGKADLFVRPNPSSLWDNAAGDILIKEAGGEIRNLQDHVSISYKQANNWRHPWLYAVGDLKFPWQNLLTPID